MRTPLEIIGDARRRIARLAAIRAVIQAAGPALAALALALALEPIGRLTWTRLGYSMAPGAAAALRIGLLIGATIAIAAGGIAAYMAWRNADDFAGAAGELDRRVQGREQIVTLASIAGPDAPADTIAHRTPLFPILWRHASDALRPVNVEREFRLDAAGPIKRSAGMAAIVAIAMAIATMGLVRAPSPEAAEAARLREIAKEIAKPDAGPADIALAESVRAAADALENPTLPPEQKRQRIEAAKRQAAQAAQQRHAEKTGKGKAAGKSASANGGAKGNGSGKSEATVGSGGAGSGGQPSKPGEKGAGHGKQNKAAQRSIELQNELAKAEAQIEAEGAKKNSATEAAGGGKNQAGPKPGENPNQKSAGNGTNPNLPGQTPQASNRGDRNVPNAGGNSGVKRDYGSHLGDTHLGEIPAPANFQHFLKPGDKGAALGIHDARYVTFRLPAAIVSGAAGGGKLVLDTGRHRASTPYVNAPLKALRSDAPPDERQPIPPRYRGMIE
ncbi:MAG: hypothetical protein ACREQI_01710 [Candidatus Binataceae bacterium]